MLKIMDKKIFTILRSNILFILTYDKMFIHSPIVALLTVIMVTMFIYCYSAQTFLNISEKLIIHQIPSKINFSIFTILVLKESNSNSQKNHIFFTATVECLSVNSL